MTIRTDLLDIQTDRSQTEIPKITTTIISGNNNTLKYYENSTCVHLTEAQQEGR